MIVGRKYGREGKDAGESKIVPKRKDESGKQRHRRRLRVAKECFDAALAWCRGRGYLLEVKANGGRWDFRLPTGEASWQPLIAELVIKHYAPRRTETHHVHDWIQVAKLLAAATGTTKSASESGRSDDGTRKEDR